MTSQENSATSPQNNDIKIIIWGTDDAAAQLTQTIQDYMLCSVTCYIDAEDTPTNQQCVHGEILYPQDLQNIDKEHAVIFVVSSVYYEALQTLEQMGFIENVNVFDGTRYFQHRVYGANSGDLYLQGGFVANRGVDPTCKLFSKPGEKIIYRGVYPEYVDTFQQMYTSCVQHDFFGGLLINTSIVHWTVPPFSLVFQHEYLHHINYPHEWSPVMIKDAALTFIALLRELSSVGMGLKDGHSFNMTFHSGRFIWIDFGSLLPYSTPPSAIFEFISTFINPLVLMRRNHYKKANIALRNMEDYISFSDIQGYMSLQEIVIYKDFFWKSINAAIIGDMETCISVLEAWIESIQSVFRFITQWEEYYGESSPFSTNESELNIKQREVLRLLHSAAPNTLLDIAGNSGWYTFRMSNSSSMCLLTDIDYHCIDKAYQTIREHGIQNVIPIVQNFVTPALPQSINTPIEKGFIYRWREGAVERFRSECVLALAIVHHLVFSQMMSFPEIIGQLSRFTTKYLLVEFIDSRDRHMTSWMNKNFDWYTQEAFERSLQELFVIIEVCSSSDEGTRFLYLCERRHDKKKDLVFADNIDNF